MAARLNIPTIFILCTFVLVLSAKNTGALNADRNSARPPESNLNANIQTLIGKLSGTDELPRKIEFEDPKRRSERMCDEYGKPTLSSTGVQHLDGSNDKVFTVTSQNCKDANKLVVGGVTATPNEFPHMVALGNRTAHGTFHTSCGGSLISPDWVLTAAHCFKERLTHVRIGLHNVQNSQEGTITTIKNTIRHPNYNSAAMYNDIALVRLNKPVEITNYIRPACLYDEFDTIPKTAVVAGWGTTDYDDDEGSNLLQKAELDIIDNLKCSTIYLYQKIAKLPYGIIPRMICAGDERGGWKKDTCQGDSGGPLQIVHPKNSCLFQVVGITSFGIGCAFPNNPGVYTRVAHYLNWIEDIVWPEH